MRRLVRAGVWVGGCALLCAPGAQAQALRPPTRPAPRVEIAAGGGWMSGTHIGTLDFDLRANAPVPRPPYRVFTAETSMSSAPTFHARLGFALTRRIGLETRFTKSGPDLQAFVTEDAEGAPPITIVEAIDRYIIEGGIVVLLDRAGEGRFAPFVSAGAGYLRELHEGQTVVEEGLLFYVGGGLKLRWLARDRGWIRTAGVRGDARVYFLSGGVAPDARPRTYGSLSGGIFIGL